MRALHALQGVAGLVGGRFQLEPQLRGKAAARTTLQKLHALAALVVACVSGRRPEGIDFACARPCLVAPDTGSARCRRGTSTGQKGIAKRKEEPVQGGHGWCLVSPCLVVARGTMEGVRACVLKLELDSEGPGPEAP